MEAANRGASEARGLNVGLTISIPLDEFDNRFTTRELSFHFHYFFMRKFWFAYLAKAMIVFPGGFGTLDELFEVLTLLQISFHLNCCNKPNMRSGYGTSCLARSQASAC